MRKRRSRPQTVRIAMLMADRETAIDYLVLTGFTKRRATERVDAMKVGSVTRVPRDELNDPLPF